MVTAAQITTYLNAIYLAQSLHMDKLARKEKTGKAEIFDDKVIAAVLNCYVKIVEDYFSQATYPGGYFEVDYNFFDEEETKEIVFRINKICDTNYFLDL
jgi:hypothetical protein